MKAFKYLVIRILKEYKQWLAPIIEDMIDLWGNNYNSGNTINGDAPLIRANDCNASSSNNASFLKEDGSKAKKYPSNAVLIEDLPTSPEETEDSTKMPKDYYYLEGKWTDAEVQLFFTFLYKEKDKNGETYLSKEATETIFKYGIAIPPEGTIVTRYKLNDGGPRSKKIVAYAIYLFFKNYSRNITEKRAILRFFGSYIEDYSAALVDEDTMVKLSGNITGDKPAKNFFNLRKYVPARVADFFKF
jgi:hypothetical protein